MSIRPRSAGSPGEGDRVLSDPRARARARTSLSVQVTFAVGENNCPFPPLDDYALSALPPIFLRLSVYVDYVMSRDKSVFSNSRFVPSKSRDGNGNLGRRRGCEIIVLLSDRYRRSRYFVRSERTDIYDFSLADSPSAETERVSPADFSCAMEDMLIGECNACL